MDDPSIHISIWKVLPWSTNKTQCLAVHYFDRASTDKQFYRLMVGIVEILTVGSVETLSRVISAFLGPLLKKIVA